MIIEYNKRIGETMGELLARFKLEYAINKECKVAFAGRLDPLAFGKVAMLTDADVYQKVNYCSKTKIYQCDIIECLQTDTYDIMGIPKISLNSFDSFYDQKSDLEYVQEYPPYSSQFVSDLSGVKRPLWYCTKNNIQYLDTPTKIVKLYSGIKLSEYSVNVTDLYELVTNRISMVKVQTFRQEEILGFWDKLLSSDYFEANNLITISKWKFQISSGGYIRYLGNQMNGSCFDIERVNYL